jgi:hypothetical protein
VKQKQFPREGRMRRRDAIQIAGYRRHLEQLRRLDELAAVRARLRNELSGIARPYLVPNERGPVTMPELRALERGILRAIAR